LNTLVLTLSYLFITSLGLAQTSRVDLQTAIQLGLTNSHRIKAAKRSLEIARMNTSDAGAKFRPNLYISSSAAGSGTIGSTEHSQTNSLGLNINQNIYNNGRDEAALDLAKGSVDLAKIDLEEADSNLKLDITTSFFTVSKQAALIGMEARKNKTIQKQFTSTEKSYKAGLTSKTDYLLLRNQKKLSELSLKRSEQELLGAKRRLKLLMGLSANANLDFTEINPETTPYKEFNPPPINLNNTFAIKKQNIQLELSGINLDLAKKYIWPEFTIGANAGITGSNSNADNWTSLTTNQTWSLSFNMNYPLWDHGTTRRILRKALLTAEGVEENRLEQFRQTEKEMIDLVEELHKGQEELQILIELLTGETQSFALISEKYRKGQLSFLDFEKSLSSLFSAKTSYISTFFNLLQLKARIIHYWGIKE